ncbi:hypothetical protein C8R44DRAFT_799930 [Mycena epipterygia]|nr:hypothetical protein C8R44DRAFT_799930 [Mycena epipterygia]
MGGDTCYGKRARHVEAKRTCSPLHSRQRLAPVISSASSCTDRAAHSPRRKHAPRRPPSAICSFAAYRASGALPRLRDVHFRFVSRYRPRP